jgi:hypothetical protein
MTSQENSDGDGRDEHARAEAGERRDSDIVAKSYRYLRLAMVGLLVCLNASWEQLRDVVGKALCASLRVRMPRTT